MNKQKWNVNFRVNEETTIVDGKTRLDKKEAIAEIKMDYEDVLMLMNIVNTGTYFSLSALDEVNFKAITIEEFDPACWNEYYVHKISSVDFDNSEIYVVVNNF